LELNCSTNTGRYMKEINMTKPEILPCREAFEEWIKKSHGSVKLDENGNYRDTPTHLAWMGWINAWERAPQASVPEGLEATLIKLRGPYHLNETDFQILEQADRELLRISTPTKGGDE